MLKIETDHDTIEALKAITRADLIRVAVGEDGDGKTRYADGYHYLTGSTYPVPPGEESPDGGFYQFINEKGQAVQVPAHRVAGHKAGKSRSMQSAPKGVSQIPGTIKG